MTHFWLASLYNQPKADILGHDSDIFHTFLIFFLWDFFYDVYYIKK